MLGKNQCEHGNLARSCEICELKKEIKAMKCCGNCKNYKYGNLCEGKLVSHDSWCESWFYDGLTRDNRAVPDEFYNS